MKVKNFATEITEHTEMDKMDLFPVTSVYAVAPFFYFVRDF